MFFPLLLTLLAGLATGIGSTMAFFAKRTNTKFLSFSLGISAGVMIYVSMVELFSDAQKILIETFGTKQGMFVTVLCFFGGILLIALIDRLVPSYENPHEIRSVESLKKKPAKDQKLMRMGLLTALAIGIHNFPEGMATFMAAIENPTLGIAIAVAIAIHNVPEGIAVSIPIYYATGDKKKAFFLSFLSGLSEPIGALLAYFILMPFLSPMLMGCTFAFVAGIMIFISLDELLPAAREYSEPHSYLWIGSRNGYNGCQLNFAGLREKNFKELLFVFTKRLYLLGVNKTLSAMRDSAVA
jgi:ZIP family zinc transporter